MDVRLTGDWDRFRRRIKSITDKLERTVQDGMMESAYTIKERWVDDATTFQLDEDYILSIEVTEEPPRGYYVGPTKGFAMTQRGVMEFEELREGDYISYTARCSIHKYTREVKRRAEPEELERYDMPNLIYQKLDEYKEIIRQIIREKIQSLMRGR